jgi:ATP-dependent RNA helicase DDX54/DBP10
MAEQVVGFGDLNETTNYTHIKKKKNAGGKKCGGFQGMGLSFPVLKGIQKRGYKLATPIQRKVILIITSYSYRCYCFIVTYCVMWI